MKKQFILLFNLLLLSCNSVTDPPISKKPEPLMPLAVGNFWVYQGYYLKDDGSIDYPEYFTFGYKISDKLSIAIKEKEITSFKCALYNPRTNYTSTKTKLIYNGIEGLYYAGIANKDTVKMLFNDLMFKIPPIKGEENLAHTFYYKPSGNYLNISDSVITNYTCVSTDSLFSTPVGDFNCVVYKLKLMLDDVFYLGDIYYFIKPGLGLVGIMDIGYSHITNKHFYFQKTVLVDYKLNQEDL